MSTGADTEAPPIRVLIAKPGLDGHDVGAKVVCRALMQAGMEVIYSGLRQSPRAIARAAADEEVEVLGLSILSGAHLPLCRKLRTELEASGCAGRVLWLVGGNIPRGDRDRLRELGVAEVFPVGTPLGSIVEFIHREVRR